MKLFLLLALVPVAFSLPNGGVVTVAVKENNVVTAANEAITLLNTKENTDRQLNKIISASVQVVAGLKYTLTVDVTNGENNEICHLTILQQAWLGHTSLLQSVCQQSHSSPLKNQENDFVGGLSKVDVTREDVMAIAIEAMTKLNVNDNTARTLNRIIDAKTQVVAGIVYKLTIDVQNGNTNEICHLTMLKQAWLHSSTLTHSECQPKAVVVEDDDSARAGGVTSVNTTRTEVIAMANDALNRLNAKEDTSRTINNIIGAKIQVVAGMKYMFTIDVQNGNVQEICHLTVLVQAWLSETTLIEHQCGRKTSRSLLGGMEAAHVNDIGLQQSIKFAVQTINAKSNSLHASIPTNISNIKKQIVAGVKYGFTMKLEESTCNKNNALPLMSCPLLSNGMTLTCDVEILFQAWTPSQFTILHDKCTNT